MINDLFCTPATDEFNRAADHVGVARSILTGIAANRSIRTGQTVIVADLVKFH